MGKRIEKAFGKDRGQGATSNQDSHDDDPNRTPEPHICTGQFQTDFTELCKRNNMLVIPQILLRPRRPPSPSSIPPADEKGGKGKGKDDKKNQPPPEPEPEPELDENGEPKEPPPKTYTTKDKFEYFKPCVQVEMDNPDKQETVTEVFVRGWKVDDPMMTIFKQCWPKMDRLNSVSLWGTGLTEATVAMLASILPDCSNLRKLVVDNNPVSAENYHLLIREECHVQHLSLRYNSITDRGAALIGECLGTPKKTNTKLLSLNLNGNRITDTGAEHLAKGLRMNRTLLSLSLANNQIGDTGASALAQVISKIFLTHEEIVERRQLLSEKGSPERQKSPGPSKRADSRDRPTSRSSHPDKKQGKSAKKKDDKGGTQKEHDKHDKTKGKKDQDKSVKKASVVADGGKTTTKKSEKGKKAQKNTVPTEQEPETPELINPLLTTVNRMDSGKLMVCGNLTLISLNLAHNRITEAGLVKFLDGIAYQTTGQLDPDTKRLGPGLMRLAVHGNLAPSGCETMQKLQEKMQTKDPFYKPTSKTPDEDQLSTVHDG